MRKDVLKEFWPGWEIDDIGNPIGEGANGIVYKAVKRGQRDQTEKVAAVKIITIPPDEKMLRAWRTEGYTADEARDMIRQLVKDVEREIATMQSLKGKPNIVDIDAFEIVEKKESFQWDIYIRMELLIPLDEYFRGKAMTEKDVIDLGIDICTAMEGCSELQIVHRDIKPGNILIRTDPKGEKQPEYKLADFGIAKELQYIGTARSVGSSPGSPDYMAPEFYNDPDATAGIVTDIYSLGLVLYQKTNKNRLPFRTAKQRNLQEAAESIKRRNRGEEIPFPCEASKELGAVILRACSFHPEDRYASAKEMKEDLMALKNNTFDATMRVRRPKQSGQSRAARQKKKSIFPRLAAALMILAVLMISGYFVYQYSITDIRAEYVGGILMVGDEIECDDFVVYAIRRNGGEKEISSFEVTPSVADESGAPQITVTAKGWSDEICVRVYEIDYITASYADEIVPYGEDFDGTKVSVTGMCTDGAQLKLEDFDYDPDLQLLPGLNEILISSQGFSTTLVLQMEIPVVTVSFDGNGVTCDESRAVAYGEEIGELPVLEDTEDEKFSGWTYNGKSVSEDYVIESAEDIVLTAEWESIVYVTVRYNANGGNCSEKTKTVVCGEEIGELPVLENITGYIFGGWLYDGDTVESDYVVAESDDIILTASWIPITYTVTFHNGNDSYTQEFVYGKSQKLAGNTFTKSLSSFVGWAASGESEKCIYTDAESVKNLAEKDGENVDLYAVWELDLSQMLEDLVNDSGTTKVYTSSEDGFSMFGATYAGVTIHIGASYNMWGGGTQYCVFNISEWTNVGNTLTLKYGHVSGGNGNRRISIYFDSDEDPTYVYDYDSTNPPQTVDIEIGAHTAMKIVVQNLSGDEPYVGISFLDLK